MERIEQAFEYDAAQNFDLSPQDSTFNLFSEVNVWSFLAVILIGSYIYFLTIFVGAYFYDLFLKEDVDAACTPMANNTEAAPELVSMKSLRSMKSLTRKMNTIRSMQSFRLNSYRSMKLDAETPIDFADLAADLSETPANTPLAESPLSKMQSLRLAQNTRMNSIRSMAATPRLSLAQSLRRHTLRSDSLRNIVESVQTPRAKSPQPESDLHFTLEAETHFPGDMDYSVVALCSKKKTIATLEAFPEILEHLIDRAIEASGKPCLVFIADGKHMAQQDMATSKNTMKRSMRYVAGYADKVESHVNAIVEQMENRDLIHVARWTQILAEDERHAKVLKVLRNNEETVNAVLDAVKCLARRRVTQFYLNPKNAGKKCSSLLDEDGNVAPKKKTRHAGLCESVSQEVATILLGFKCNDHHYTTMRYMTEDSSGMDIISGCAAKILEIVHNSESPDLKSLQDQLPVQMPAFKYERLNRC